MTRTLFAATLVGAPALALACGSEVPEPLGIERASQLAPCSEAGSSAGGAAGTASGGAAAVAGSGGMSGGLNQAGTGGTPFMPGPPYVAPTHQDNLIHVENRCSFPLWIHGIGGGGILMPDGQQLAAGGSHDYTRGDWPFAYIDAFLDGPEQNLIARAEVTFFPGNYVSYRLNYNDGIGLPMELHAIGPGADCKPVACYATQAQIMSECPEGLLSGKRCLSAGEYCKDAANAEKPYCHALDAAIAQCAATVPGCADAAGATTAQAYNCGGPFGDKPQLCAAVNRGTLSDPASANEAAFFATSPHNSYAAWLHRICPGLSAFPYDDANITDDGFHTCIDPEGGTQLNVTFCPAG
ncbi:MAG TPA: beta-1,3-glucanase family protein [Polyangiaceae bacterium]|nr:beta-1,3-glucanase family protein [Polyangiaceae bacterium]